MAQQSSTIRLSERAIYRLNLADHHHVYVVATVEDVAEDGVYAYLTTLADWGNGLGASYAVLTDGQVIEYPSVGSPVVVATDGALHDTNRTAEYADVMGSVAIRVMDRIGLNDDQLNSMYAAGPVNGWVGTVVADDIRRDWSLDPQMPLGMALAECGVLTDEEAAYLDDTE